jgi:hypothetical protein
VQEVVAAIGKLRPTFTEKMQGTVENTRFKLPPEVMSPSLKAKQA